MQVFGAVWSRLAAGDCVGIFPEGGSHDRTELLPLKAGYVFKSLYQNAKQTSRAKLKGYFSMIYGKI